MAVGQLTHLANAVTDSSANSISCTVPNNGTVAVGDLLIWATVIASGSRTFTSTGVSNISFAGSAAVTGHGTHIWYKIVESGDLGSVITCTPSTGAVKMGMILGYVTGADPTNPFSSPAEVSGAGTLTVSTTKTTPTVTATAGGREISIVADSRNASSPNSDWTSGAASGETFRGQAVTATSAGNQYSTIAWGDSNSTVSGSTGARTWTATQSAPGSAWTLIVKVGVTNVNDSDTATGSDSQSIVANVNDSDTVTGADTESAGNNTNDPDTGSGTETAFISLSDTETGTGADTESIAATNSDTETGTGTEVATISVSDTDTGSGVDSEAITQGANDSDINTGTETGFVTATLTDTDTGTGTESTSIAATLNDSDTANSAEAYDLVVSISDSDTANSTESATAVVGTSTTPSDSEGGSSGESWSIQIFNAPVAERSLVLGPATLYIAPFGAVEPALGAVASDPDSLVWTDLGGILGGVDLTVEQEWMEVELKQLPDKPMKRLKKRRLSIKTALAEPTLANLSYALNESAPVSGVFEASNRSEASVLSYNALIVDGWAPGSNAGGRHKRRRIIIRKCLSIDNVELGYTKDGQSVYTVTWTCHYVDSVIPIFRIVDEA